MCKDENKLKMSIVRRIQEELFQVNRRQNLPRNTFGLDNLKIELVDFLGKMGSDSVGALGLVGTGGIGKTTLAKRALQPFLRASGFWVSKLFECGYQFHA